MIRALEVLLYLVRTRYQYVIKFGKSYAVFSKCVLRFFFSRLQHHSSMTRSHRAIRKFIVISIAAVISSIASYIRISAIVCNTNSIYLISIELAHRNSQSLHPRLAESLIKTVRTLLNDIFLCLNSQSKLLCNY